MVNGNNYELAEEGRERESDGTIEVGEIDDILDSVSTIDQDLDWVPPLKLDTDRFTGKVTHVDWGFNLYIQITERSKLAFCCPISVSKLAETRFDTTSNFPNWWMRNFFLSSYDCFAICMNS